MRAAEYVPKLVLTDELRLRGIERQVTRTATAEKLADRAARAEVRRQPGTRRAGAQARRVGLAGLVQPCNRAKRGRGRTTSRSRAPGCA